jgi:hypothetical protein
MNTVHAVRDHGENKKQNFTLVHVYIANASVCFDSASRVRVFLFAFGTLLFYDVQSLHLNYGPRFDGLFLEYFLGLKHSDRVQRSPWHVLFCV